MQIEWGKVIAWIATGGITLFAWLWKGHEVRLKTLEDTRVNKVDADRQRTELRDEIKEFRGDITGRFETLRIDTSGRFEKLTDQLTDIAGRLPRKSGR